MELPRPPPCVQPSEAKSLGRGNSDGRVILSGEGGAKREWAGPTLCGWANLEGRGQPRSFRANPWEGEGRGQVGGVGRIQEEMGKWSRRGGAKRGMGRGGNNSRRECRGGPTFVEGGPIMFRTNPRSEVGGTN